MRVQLTSIFSYHESSRQHGLGVKGNLGLRHWGEDAKEIEASVCTLGAQGGAVLGLAFPQGSDVLGRVKA